jgi:hypothetical protein
MASSDLLSNIRDELDARLRELRPVLDEYENLLAAAAALEPVVDTSTRTRSSPRAEPKSAPRRRSTIAPKRGAVAAAPKRAARSAGAAAPKGAPRIVRAAAPKQALRAAGATAPKRAPRSAVAGAILAALEHGSHTISELAVVTAMSAQIINNDLRRLQQSGAIARTKREGDGKAAYALTATPA